MADHDELGEAEGQPVPTSRELARSRAKRELAEWSVATLAIGVALSAALHLALRDRVGDDDHIARIEGLVAFTAAVLLVVCGRLVLPALARARREAWARSQPFRLIGYPVDFAGTIATSRFAIEVEYARPTDQRATSFRDAAPRHDMPFAVPTDAELLRSVDAAVLRTSKPWTRRIELTVGLAPSRYLANARAALWVERVTAVLVTVHARHPIAEVRVLGYVK